MNVVRAVGVAVLSLVDALVPSAIAALTVLFLAVDPTIDAARPYVLAAGSGVVVFVGTLAVGFTLTTLGHGPFPVTRATKRV